MSQLWATCTIEREAKWTKVNHIDASERISAKGAGGMMEESRREKADNKEQKRQIATVAPVAPEREMPRVQVQEAEEEDEQAEGSEPASSAGNVDAELAIML